MRGFLLCALIAPLVAGAQAGNARGAELTAGSTREFGFAVIGGDPLGMSFDEGPGSVSITATDAPDNNDRAEIRAEISLRTGRYRITADLTESSRIAAGPPGGVAQNLQVHGGGFGLPQATGARAAFAVAAIGSVYRDDDLLTDRAVVYGFAITDGTHADDSTHQVLPVARPGDTEIELLVTNVPGVPGGFLRIFWDDVNISVAGADPRNVAAVPTAPGERPEDVVATRNWGTTLLPQVFSNNAGVGGSGGGTNAQNDAAPPNGTANSSNVQPNPNARSSGLDGQPNSNANPDGTLDVSSGQVTGTRRFENGQPVAVTGTDVGSQTVGGQTQVSSTVDGATQVPVFPSATDATGVGTTVRVANSNAATPLPGTVRPLNASAAPALPPAAAALNSSLSTTFPGTVSTTSTTYITPANSTGLAPTTPPTVNPNAAAIGTSSTQFPGLNSSSINPGFAQTPATVGLPDSASSGIGVGSALSGTANSGVGGSGAFGTDIGFNNNVIDGSPFNSSFNNNAIGGAAFSSSFNNTFGTSVNGAAPTNTTIAIQPFNVATNPTTAVANVPNLNGFNTAVPQTSFGGSNVNGFNNTSAAQAINGIVPNPSGGAGTITTLPGAGFTGANIPGSNTGGFAGLPVVGGSGTFPGLMPSAVNPVAAPAPTSGAR